MSKTVVKSRVWTFIFYPESAPAEWRDIMLQSGLKIAVSPLHDRDFTDDGKPKKPHYHVIAMWDGPTTDSVAREFASLFGVPYVQKPISLRGCLDYLTHDNAPKKAQYDHNERIFLNGFNPESVKDWTKSDISKMKMAITKLIIKYGILEYSDLIEYFTGCADLADFSDYPNFDLGDLWDCVSSNTLFFDSYCRSRRFRDSRNLQNKY